MLHHYIRALILAARGKTWPFLEDIGDQGPFTADFDAPWRVAAPRVHHADVYVQFCGAGLVLRGPRQMLPSPFLNALSLVNSAVV